MRWAAVILVAAALSACAGTPEPVAVVPADLVRPPCHPPADLMVKPSIPRVRAGESMPERGARDGTWMTTTARDFSALQFWIQDRCQ
jgi:hypothetical protein